MVDKLPGGGGAPPASLTKVEGICLKILSNAKEGVTFEEIAGQFKRVLGEMADSTLLQEIEMHLSDAVEKIISNWRPDGTPWKYELAITYGDGNRLREFVERTITRWVEELRERLKEAAAASSAQVATPPRVCPRCRGSMIAESDWYGSYASCLQCGYSHEPTPPPEEILIEDNQPVSRKRTPSHRNIRL